MACQGLLLIVSYSEEVHVGGKSGVRWPPLFLTSSPLHFPTPYMQSTDLPTGGTAGRLSGCENILGEKDGQRIESVRRAGVLIREDGD